MKKLLQVFLEVALISIGFAVITPLISDSVKQFLVDHLGNDERGKILYQAAIWGTLILILLGYVYIKYRLEFKHNAEKIFTVNRKQFIQNLRGLYRASLKSKLHDDIKHKIELTLSYTTLGSDKDYVAQNFISGLVTKKKIEDFKELYENLKENIIRLLILGEPGSGKSTLLLQFGLELLKEAEKDTKKPIPLLLNLSSWTNANKSVEEWLENNLAGLSGNFIISGDYAKALAKSDKIVVLLDGFDEIAEWHRSSFLKALKKYVDKRDKNEHITVQLILCSRINEYKMITDNAPVQASVVIEPIGAMEVADILKQTVERSKTKRNAAAKLLKEVEENPQLTTLLNNAFHLNLAINIKGSLAECATRTELLNFYTWEQLGNVNEKYNKATIFKTFRWLTKNQLKYGLGLKFELMDISTGWSKLKYVVGVLAACLMIAILHSTYLSLAPLNDFVVYPIISLRGVYILIAFTLLFSFDMSLKLTPKRFSTKYISLRQIFSGIVFFLGLAIGYSLHILWFWFDDVHPVALKGYIISYTVLAFFIPFLTIAYTDAPLSYQRTAHSRLFSNLKYGFLTMLAPAIIILLSLAIAGVFTFYSLIFIFPLTILLATLFWSRIIQFFCLYLVLKFEYGLPARPVKFMNYMADKTGIIEREGVKWRFKHKLIQEWFIENDFK